MILIWNKERPDANIEHVQLVGECLLDRDPRAIPFPKKADEKVLSDGDYVSLPSIKLEIGVCKSD